MKDQAIYIVAGVVAGFGLATLVFVSVYGGEETAPDAEGDPAAQTAQQDSPDQADQAAQTAEQADSPQDPNPGSGNAEGSGETSGEQTSGDGPPGDGYVKTGEITKEIDLKDLQKGSAEKSGGPRGGAAMLKVGEPNQALLGAPEDAPKDFKYQTNFHAFRGQKGQTLQITIAAENEQEGLRPLVMLWNSGDDGAPEDQLAVKRNDEGGSVTIEHTFEESGRFLLTVEDARNLPLDKPEPEEYYGGENFGYTITLTPTGG